MAQANGFLEYKRKNGAEIPASQRIQNFKEFHERLSLEEQRLQAARCMDCGVPFCQSGMTISGMASGCPLHNLIPEFNDLVYNGNMEQAYRRLEKTNCFPEFTSAVCPALCEAACTCGLQGEPVSTKENERAIIEYAFEHNLVLPNKPKTTTGKKIAIVGSGPAGLAAAMKLRERGHEVTVYERSDRPGGLLRYGIPNMKLDKEKIDRRIKIMEQMGITFICNTNIGVDVEAEQLKKEYDRIVLTCGASKPRDIFVKGREAKGIYFAVDYLTMVTKTLLDSEFTSIPYHLAKGKDVLIIGGGDTGNDCVGTAIRLGAKSVIQLEMMPMLSRERQENNPWPEWPKVLKTDYGQEEAIHMFSKDPRRYQTTVTQFLMTQSGEVCGATLIKLEQKYDEKQKKMVMTPIEGSEESIKVDLVLIAAGFVGTEDYIAEAFGIVCDERGNVKTEPHSYETSVKGIFSAGDMRRGQSLVVWAIEEGKRVAKQVDCSLMGYTNL